MLGLLTAVQAQMAGFPGNSTIPGGNAANVTAAQTLLGDYAGPGLAPSGDTTGVTDSANIANLLATAGIVLFQPGTFYIDAPITPDSFQLVQGYGYKTLIETGSSFTGSYMIQLAHPATTAEVTIRSLRLYPSANSITGCGGVQLDNTGFGPSGIVPNDTGHVLDEIFVVLAGADAFHFDNNIRNLCARRCDSYNATGYGFYIGNGGGIAPGCTDSEFTNCTAGHGAQHAFYILGANNMFTSCKAWGSGYSGALTGGGITGTTECGFEVVSTEKNTFVGCQAQQNALHGFDLQSCFQTGVTGCDSDANSAGSAVTIGVGINLNASTQCAIAGNVGDGTISGQPGAQIYGIQASGNCSATWIAANSVTGTATTFHAGSAATGYSVLDNTNITDFTHLNNFRIGSPQLYEGASGLGTVSTNTTITVGRGQGAYPLTSSGNVTGLILSTGGLSGGQTVSLINTTDNTMSFAPAATSNVAGGANDIVPPLGSVLLTYDSNTSLWYPSGGEPLSGGYLCPPVQYAPSAQVQINTLSATMASLNAAATTVAAGSNGGEISLVASWSSPSAGVLDVASTAGWPSAGTFTVAASGPTTAICTYTGTTAATLTGCAYVSGSATGTVATGGAVTLTAAGAGGGQPVPAISTGSFTAPPSGSVVVTASFAAKISGTANMSFGLVAHNTLTPMVCDNVSFTDSAAATARAYQVPFVVGSLTAGSAYTFDLMFATSANTLSVVAYGAASTAPTGTLGGPVTLTVQAV